jgi:hypothetical protein
MKLLRVLSPVAAAAIVLWLAYGCSGVTQMDPSQIADFTTLTVTYGDPGGSPDPCNDVLPQIDGVAEEREWMSAEPIFLRATGANGTGGAEYYVEVRAIWTDESRVGGTDRIYFLVRYPDNDNNYKPDYLLYARRNPVTGEFVSSPFPDTSATPDCDPGLLMTEPPDSVRWTRINADGQEDQVFVMLTEAPDEEPLSDIVSLNQELMTRIGVKGPGAATGVSSGGRPTDVWVWRAGRTNLQPVPQFAKWEDIVAGVPDFGFSKFQQLSGFCEDLWVDANSLSPDGGSPMYVPNWNGSVPVPLRLTQCPTSSREPTEEDLAARNKGIPPDLGLWYPTSTRFVCGSVLACSRLGTPNYWGARLQSGEYDGIQGWGLQLPTDSARDVRARAAYTINQDKGFPVRTLEIMRDLNTGNGDDIVVNPDGTHSYRMVIGVLNNSSSNGSGSTEIRLQFESRKPRVGTARRC